MGLLSVYFRVPIVTYLFLVRLMQVLLFYGLICVYFPTPLYSQTLSLLEQINTPDNQMQIELTNQDSMSFTLSDAEKHWLSEHKIIRLGIDPKFAPIAFMDEHGNYSGIAADYVKLLSQRLGISLQVVADLKQSQALEFALKGEVDILAAITPTQDTEPYLDFTKPYFKYPLVIYTRSDFPVISGLESLRRNKVTAVKGYFSHEMAKQLYPELDLITVNTSLDGLTAVSEGRADAFIGDVATVTFEIRKNNLADLKIAAPAGFTSPGYSFAVRKDWPELVSIINKVIDTISPEEHLNISNKWVQIKVKKSARYWYWMTVCTAGLVVLFIVTSMIFRIQVKHRTAELSLKNEQLIREDIERRFAEKAVIDSEKRLVQFFHATFEMMFFHENGRILDVNPATTKILGYAHEDVIGKSISEFVVDDSRQDVIVRTKKGILEPYEADIITKSGTIMPVEIHPSNFELEGRNLMVVGLRDITERRKSEQALRRSYALLESRVEHRTAELMRANSKLQELDRLKSLFIASVSHELRTPLNSVIGFSSMMMQATFGELNEKYTDYVTRINLAGQHLLSLITDIIDISKIESGFVDVELSDFELDEIVDEAVNIVRPQSEKKGLSLKVTIPQNLTIHSDRMRLLQCLLNLLSNAIKYSEQGQIAVFTEDLGEQVVILVRDTGIGVSEEDMPQLFEAFERIETHLRVKAGGTGLGLYLTKKITNELLQGEVGVSSKLNEGSTFWIKIPKML